MTSTIEQRLEQIDHDADELKQAIVDAIVHLHGAPEVDDSFEQRLHAIAERSRRLRTELQPEDFDKAQLDELWRAVVDLPDLLAAAPDLEAYDQVLVRVERIRHVVRDALDEHVAGLANDTAAVMEELRRRLPTTTRSQLAELLGVRRRTLPRWQRQTGRPPGRRLQLVARLVAILRHAWTEEGVVAWFHRPRRELGGRAPLDVLDDPAVDERALISMARAGRSQHAA